MPISKEYSLVADSTMSLTSPEPSPVVKRATRTYGRRRGPDVADTPLSHSDTASIDSSRSIYKTGPMSLDEEIPPSSDAPLTFSEPEQADDEGEASDDEKARETAGFQFSWKKQLQALDEQDDFDNIPSTSFGSALSGSQQMLCDDASLSPTKGKGTCAPPESTLLTGDLPLFPRIAEGSRTSNTNSPSYDLATSSSHKLGGAGARRRAVVRDSDSDSPSPSKSSSHPATSPQVPNPINTPKSRSSTTPPTSDDDMGGDQLANFRGKTSTTRNRLLFTPQGTNEEGPSDSASASGKGKPKDVTRRTCSSKGGKGKVKAPTKKELAETTRARARLAADQHVSIARTEVPQKYALSEFFAKLSHPPHQMEASIASIPSSDPITQYSSSPAKQTVVGNATVPPARRTTPPPLEPPLSGHHSDSDEELDVNILTKDRKVKANPPSMTKKNAALLEKKMKALAEQRSKVQDESDDDLVVVNNTTAAQDMHIVAQEAAEERRAQKQRHLGPSKGKRIIERFGHVRAKKGEAAQLSQVELNRQLAERVAEKNRQLVKQKEEEWVRRGGTIKSNVEVVAGDQRTKALEDTWKAYAEKGRLAMEQNKQMQEEPGSDEDEDWIPGDPALRGSASPEPNTTGQQEDQMSAEIGAGDGDITMVNEDDTLRINSSQKTGDEENLAVPAFRRSRATIVLNSDSEDENVIPTSKFQRNAPSRTESAPTSPSSTFGGAPTQSPTIPTIAHRGSVSSFEYPTEDENDKENSTRLMYDKSDDKENKAVVRHGLDVRPPFGTRKASLRGLEEDVRRGLSTSPGATSPGENGRNEMKARRPFGELSPDDDPFASPSTSMSFTARLLKASPQAASSTQGSSSTFVAKCFSPQKIGEFGASQFSDERQENDENAPFKVPSLQPGFSQLFESQTQTAGPSNKGLDELRKQDALNDLPLTLDVTLQPALEVSDNVRKQAETVFEKEQEYLIEAAQAKKPQPQLYVNDHGFLTQTRPDVASPEVYKMFSPSQRNSLFRSQTHPNVLSQTPSHAQASLESQGSRHPLRTISFSMSDELDQDTPDTGMLRRLRRRRTSSPSPRKDGYESSPSQSPIKTQPLLNAFDVLARKAAAEARRSKDPQKGKVSKFATEFVEAEAEESDDDLGTWGVRNKEDDDEAEGPDADTTLVELVDDSNMDKEAEAADKVLEKYQEHLQQDDEALQKYHQDAVDGKMRHKRRNGVGFDDSDDETDDEAAAIRRKMHKRPRIDRGDIQALGKTEETQAFFKSYKDSLMDDDQEWVGMSQQDPMAPAQAGSEDDEDDPEDRPQKSVSYRGIEQEIRERLENNDELETIDVNDISWLDAGERLEDDLTTVEMKDISHPVSAEGGAGRVSSKKGWMNMDLDLDIGPSKRTMSKQQVRGMARSDTIPTIPDDGAGKDDETLDAHARQRMQQWAQGERRSGRLETTGRSVGSVAVTGHKGASGKVRMKGRDGGKATGVNAIGKGTSAKGALGEVSASAKRPLKTSKSVLSGVDRRGRFE